MDISILEEYIFKAKSYGKNLCVVGRTIPDEIVEHAKAIGLSVKCFNTDENITCTNIYPALREYVQWAHTLISIDAQTISLRSDEVCCVLSTVDVQTDIPYEIFHDGWQAVERTRPANQKETLALWEDVKLVWPAIYHDYGDTVALIDAGANGDTFFTHYTMQTLLDHVLPMLSTGVTKFLFCNIQETLQTGPILKAQHFAEITADKIGIHNVAFVTSAINAENAWQTYSQQHNIENPIRVISGNYYDVPWREQYIAMTGQYDVPEFNIGQVPEKLFVCLNNTPRWHRTQLGVMLEHHGLLDKGYYSLRNIDQHHVQLLDMDSKYDNAKTSLASKVPIHLDDVDRRETHIAFTQASDIELHQKSGVSLVTETIYQSDGKLQRDGGTEYVPDCVFYTEKTYKPYWFMQPFLVLAVPGFLAEMRKLGWLTFDPWIDESYDIEPDDDKRMEMIVDEIVRLSKFTRGDWLQFRQGVNEAVQINGRRIRREHPGGLHDGSFKDFFR